MKIALIQNRDHGSPAKNLIDTEEKIQAAAVHGAKIICTQELFLNPYFCREQTEENFKFAEPIPGQSSEQLGQIAKENDIILIASLFEKAMSGLYYNTTVIFNTDGSTLGKYRKNHIPQDPYFEEKFYFAPGDLGYPVFDTIFGKIGILICWDQWYPEAARLLALQGAQIIFAPTAIGWLTEEKEELGAKQHSAWLQVQRGHAVANSCFFAAVNRIGKEEPIEFWGQSFVANHYGEIISTAAIDQEETLYADCDLDSLDAHRQMWPFFRDRRIDTYTDILKRSL
jgi:N-carbamoylputrescine amidase